MGQLSILCGPAVFDEPAIHSVKALALPSVHRCLLWLISVSLLFRIFATCLFFCFVVGWMADE